MLQMVKNTAVETDLHVHLAKERPVVRGFR